jgi:hypothetical protein
MVPLQVHPGRTFDANHPLETSPPYFTASAVVADGNGVGEIGFGVSSASESIVDATNNCGPRFCTVRSGPHGELITVLDIGGGSEVHVINVSICRGGSVVFGSASNAISPTTVETVGGASQQKQLGRTDLPISVDNLVEILLGPELTLFP